MKKQNINETAIQFKFKKHALSKVEVSKLKSNILFLSFLIFNFSFLIGGFAQNIAINTTGAAANSSALLEVGTGTDTKGLLIPRVSLLSTTDVATIASPATSLLIYNTNTAMTGGSVGFWYWDGTKWVKYITQNNSTSVNSHCFTCDGF